MIDTEEQQLLDMHIKEETTQKKMGKKSHFMPVILNLIRIFSSSSSSMFHLAGLTPDIIHNNDKKKNHTHTH